MEKSSNVKMMEILYNLFQNVRCVWIFYDRRTMSKTFDKFVNFIKDYTKDIPDDELNFIFNKENCIIKLIGSMTNREWHYMKFKVDEGENTLVGLKEDYIIYEEL